MKPLTRGASLVVVLLLTSAGTASAGLTIPPSLLARADQVIE